MKRIAIAAILALGIHGFLLGLKFDLLQRISRISPKPRVMNISLVPRQPRITTPKASASKPKPKIKKHPVEKTIQKKPKHFLKPKPKKVIKEVIQKTEKGQK